MSTATAPLEIGHVALTVHDLAAMTDFYLRALGLTLLETDGPHRRLGAGGRVLLELREDRAARRADPREAGLFHTAFLLPDRQALARWLNHAAALGLRLQGASDHLVSEAIYLADPEGNGIEVYADRPRSDWYGIDGAIRMASEPLDLGALARRAHTPWTAAPEATVIGHVHLQVGDIARAETFLAGTLGLAVTARHPGAAFFGSGGYHHHVAANVWNSRGAAPRRFPVTGLAELVLSVDAATRAAILAPILARGSDDRMTDPWGTPVTLMPKVP